MARPPLSIIDFFNMESAVATEFRRLLHNLRTARDGGEIKSLLITSSMLSEGKSTNCILLALTAAKKGLKTLIIDCDVRRPSIHKLLVMPRDNGLTEVLEGKMMAKNVVKKTTLEKLDVITAGRETAMPTEVFDARQIGALVSEMKFFYDLVLLDCAPIIPVSDPMLLANEVDAIVIVVKVGATQREIVRRACDIMRSQSNRLLGVILNNMEGGLPSYYDTSHYGYSYQANPPKRPSTKPTDRPHDRHANPVDDVRPAKK